MEIKNKKIVLIGCTGNLGKPIYNFLNQKNNKIILLSRVKPKFLKKGDKNYFFKMDFTQEENIKNAIFFVKQKFGFPDLVVNGVYTREKNISEKDLISNLTRNSKGLYLVNKFFGDFLKKNSKGGSIVVLNSIYSHVAPNFNLYKNKRLSPTADYNFIKGGIISQVKFFAAEYGKYKVRFNSISYGGIKNHLISKKFEKAYTSRVPMKRMMSSKDVGGILLFLASEHSSYITGNNIFVDGGYVCC